jgi:hypothetical protein
MPSFQAVYDVNLTGNPFHASIYKHPHIICDNFVGIPIADDFIPPASQASIPPTALNQFAAFFRPCPLPHKPIQLQSNDVFGDAMQIPAPSNTTRLYFINLNGLNLQKKAVKFRDLCEDVRKYEIDILAAAEHNLDTNKFIIRQSLQDIAHKLFENHCIQTATSSTVADKFYKPGGTMIMAHGNLVGQVTDRGSNSLSRWSWLKLVGKKQRLITIISAYQVCVRPTNQSGTTAYHQQESLLCQ